MNSLIGGHRVTGMKVDVEGFEQALGTGRKPVADLLAGHGYQLYRPDPSGQLRPAGDLGFGPDVFARPASVTSGPAGPSREPSRGYGRVVPGPMSTAPPRRRGRPSR